MVEEVISCIKKLKNALVCIDDDVQMVSGLSMLLERLVQEDGIQSCLISELVPTMTANSPEAVVFVTDHTVFSIQDAILKVLYPESVSEVHVYSSFSEQQHECFWSSENRFTFPAYQRFMTDRINHNQGGAGHISVSIQFFPFGMHSLQLTEVASLVLSGKAMRNSSQNRIACIRSCDLVSADSSQDSDDNSVTVASQLNVQRLRPALRKELKSFAFDLMSHCAFLGLDCRRLTFTVGSTAKLIGNTFVTLLNNNSKKFSQLNDHITQDMFRRRLHIPAQRKGGMLLIQRSSDLFTSFTSAHTPMRTTSVLSQYLQFQQRINPTSSPTPTSIAFSELLLIGDDDTLSQHMIDMCKKGLQSAASRLPSFAAEIDESFSQPLETQIEKLQQIAAQDSRDFSTIDLLEVANHLQFCVRAKREEISPFLHNTLSVLSEIALDNHGRPLNPSCTPVFPLAEVSARYIESNRDEAHQSSIAQLHLKDVISVVFAAYSLYGCVQWEQETISLHYDSSALPSYALHPFTLTDIGQTLYPQELLLYNCLFNAIVWTPVQQLRECTFISEAAHDDIQTIRVRHTRTPLVHVTPNFSHRTV